MERAPALPASRRARWTTGLIWPWPPGKVTNTKCVRQLSMSMAVDRTYANQLNDDDKMAVLLFTEKRLYPITGQVRSDPVRTHNQIEIVIGRLKDG